MAVVRGATGVDRDEPHDRCKGVPTVEGVVVWVANVADVSQALFTDFVLAFEVLAVLLLAGMVGAIVIARRRDPGQAEEGA